MTIYALITVLSVISASAAESIRLSSDHKRGYRVFYFFSFLPVALVSALRYETGTDWWIYDSFFHSINSGGERFAEPGFNLLNMAVYLFSREVSALVAVVALLTYFFVFRGIFGRSVSAPLSILIYVIGADYFNSFNQIRQALAAAVFLYAARFIWERKALSYFAWIAAASTIHFGAVFLLPLYFLYGIKADFRVHAAALISAALSLPLVGRLFVYIVERTRYGWYIGSVYDRGSFYLSGYLFMLGLLVLYNYYNLYSQDIIDDKYSFMSNTCLLSVLLLTYTAYVPQILRLVSMLGIINCLGVPMLVEMERRKDARVILCLLIIFAFTAKLLYDVYVNGWYGVIPYKSVFSR